MGARRWRSGAGSEQQRAAGAGVGKPLSPQQARWIDSRGAHLALLRYDDARAAADPRTTVLDFYESAYRAGATRAGWDLERLRYA